jgi:hypothetical protein
VVRDNLRTKEDPVRPVLKPGLRRLWRDGATLQLGVDPDRAVILTDLTTPAINALDALDGSRSLGALLGELCPQARELVAVVEAAGLLDDATVDPGHTAVPMIEHERFLPDAAALSLRSDDPTFARRLTERRRRSRIRVQGAGRVGSQVATLLAAGGVGRVVVDDAGVATPADVAPAGLRLDDIGRPRSVAAGAAVARVTRLPGARSRRPQAPFRPDLAVIAPIGMPVVHPADSLELETSGVPHLLAGVRETTGIVGPLVVPGRTSCLHCQHLHRNRLDAAWPLLALQMSRRSATNPDPCEITLATLVAALAAMQALEFIDSGCRPGAGYSGEETEPGEGAFGASARGGGPLPPTADGTLELAVPDWRIRRRSWPVHPECPCRASRARAAEPDTGSAASTDPLGDLPHVS